MLFSRKNHWTNNPRWVRIKATTETQTFPVTKTMQTSKYRGPSERDKVGQGITAEIFLFLQLCFKFRRGPSLDVRLFSVIVLE